VIQLDQPQLIRLRRARHCAFVIRGIPKLGLGLAASDAPLVDLLLQCLDRAVLTLDRCDRCVPRILQFLLQSRGLRCVRLRRAELLREIALQPRNFVRQAPVEVQNPVQDLPAFRGER
jgi:hypothetical protein